LFALASLARSLTSSSVVPLAVYAFDRVVDVTARPILPSFFRGLGFLPRLLPVDLAPAQVPVDDVVE
jgi:hypothetical protein